MTATSTPLAVPTDLDYPEAKSVSLPLFGTDDICVTDLQDRRGRSTLTRFPIRSSLVENDRVRHTEAGYASR